MLEIKDISEKIGNKEEHFEIQLALKLNQCEEITPQNRLEVFLKYDEIEKMLDHAAKMPPQQKR